MTSDPLIDDAYAERLLRRRGVSGPGASDPLSAFVAGVAALEQSGPVPAPTGALARLLVEGFDPAPEHGAAAPLDVPSRSVLRARPGRREGFRVLAKILAGAGVAVVGLATAASAGALPDSLQDRVSGVLEATTPFEFPSATTPTPNAPAVTPPGSPPARTPPEDGRRAPGPAADVPGTPRPATPTVELPPVVPAPDGVPGPPAGPSPSDLRPGQQPAERGGPPDDGPGQPAGPSEQAPGRDRSPDSPGGSQLVPPGLAAKR